MAADAISPALLVLVPIVIAAGLLRFGLFKKRPGRRRDFDQARGADSGAFATIPLIAGFTGLRRTPPWIAVMSNSLNPTLRFGPDGIEYRVLRRRYVPYDRIRSVEVGSAPATTNLRFVFRGAALTFTANLGSKAAAREALGLLPGFVPRGKKAAQLEQSTVGNRPDRT